jgi:hypothetical protein
MSVRKGKADIVHDRARVRKWPQGDVGHLLPFLAILSGRHRSAAAKLGWIVIARGLVLEDRRKARVFTLAGANDDMSRFGVMHPCRVGRSTKGDQKAQGQNRTHRICSHRPNRILNGARAAPPQSIKASRSLEPWTIVCFTTSWCRSRTCAATYKIPRKSLLQPAQG